MIKDFKLHQQDYGSIEAPPNTFRLQTDVGQQLKDVNKKLWKFREIDITSLLVDANEDRVEQLVQMKKHSKTLLEAIDTGVNEKEFAGQETFLRIDEFHRYLYEEPPQILEGYWRIRRNLIENIERIAEGLFKARVDLFHLSRHLVQVSQY